MSNWDPKTKFRSIRERDQCPSCGTGLRGQGKCPSCGWDSSAHFVGIAVLAVLILIVFWIAVFGT